MIFFVMGIGHLSDAECNEVLVDVSRRAVNMKKALAYLQVEVNHLEMIKFQVSQRKVQLAEKGKKR